MAFNALTVIGSWNAATNDRGLRSGRGQTGDAYLVAVPGGSDIGPNGRWNVGDCAFFALDRWVRIPFGGSRGARPGEMECRAIGDGVKAADGSWSGTDCTVALRVDIAIAIVAGLRPYLPDGNYITSGTLVNSTDVVSDDGGIRGEEGRTRIIWKAGALAANSILLNFAGVLEVDGINTTPVYYFTRPAKAGATTAQLNTLVGIEEGKSIMFIDNTRPLYHYSAQIAGTKCGTYGQVVEVRDVQGVGPIVHTLQTGAYDPDTGLVVLQVQPPITAFGVGDAITLTDLTGTGAFADFLGDQITIDTTRGAVITFLAEELLEATTITSGTVSFGVPTPNTIRFLPALEVDYAGTATTPLTLSTCARRLSRSPKRIIVEGIIFDYDALLPNINTQAFVRFSALDRPKLRKCEFYGVGTGLGVLFGTHDFEISDTHWENGGPLSYCITNSGGVSRGRIFNCSAKRSRHLVNTGADVSVTCGPSHITVTNCQAWGMEGASFADHPGVRNLTYTDCLAVGNISQYAPGFLLRGTDEALINCRSYGHVGPAAQIIYGSGAVIDGGLYAGSRTGIEVTRAINTTIKNYPILQDNALADIFLDMATPVTPFDQAYPGLYVEAETRSAPVLANVVYRQRSANFPPAWPLAPPLWNFKTRAQNRKTTYMVARPTPIVSTVSVGSYNIATGLLTLTSTAPISHSAGTTVTLSALTGTGAFASFNGLQICVAPTGGLTTTIAAPGFAASTIAGGTISFGLFSPSFYPFREEFAGRVVRKYAAFDVTPGLDATYECDSTRAAVPATLPPSGVYPDQRVKFKKPNTGGNAVTIVGTVDGVSSPTMADQEVKTVNDSGRRFPIQAGSYTSGSGLVSLTMLEAMPFSDGSSVPAGVTVTISGLTGTGANLASLEGVRTTLAFANTKLVRYTDSTGLGTIVITGGWVTINGWSAL